MQVLVLLVTDRLSIRRHEPQTNQATVVANKYSVLTQREQLTSYLYTTHLMLVEYTAHGQPVKLTQAMGSKAT